MNTLPYRELHETMPRLEVVVKLKTALSIAGLASLLVVVGSCGPQATQPEPDHDAPRVDAVPRTFQPDPRETHFSELVMLTDGGENAEAYFSFDGSSLIFQSTRPPYGCDQIFIMGTDGSDLGLVSTGSGRTTCGYFLPGDQRILYSSTHLGDPECPPRPDFSRGYVWPIDPNYDIFTANPDGSRVARLTDTPGYDAEATISPAGDRIVFTSMRNGDLDIYTMSIDGSDVRQLTAGIGYDGGPFFSPDGARIVYRTRHPSDPEEIADYRALLAENLIRPSKLEVWVMDADGSDKRQVTDLGVAAFAPFFHPLGERIIFSSNHGDPAGREFELFMINLDGTGLEQITHSKGFDGFPMWAPDRETFVFCSNRHNSKEGETNVFVTTWQE
jgi:Tol biopolymer transport system component